MNSSTPARCWQLLADPFSWEGWRHEGAERVFPPKGLQRSYRWRKLTKNPPIDKVEFLLIESAWEFFRSRQDRYTKPIELAQSYRKAGIPVVYWNKEDPICFEEFHNVALACDIVLTTDRNAIDLYRGAGFKGPIDVMTFPVQPRIHQQYLEKDPSRLVFFAGTFRDKYETRRQTYKTLIRPSLEFGLDIFSRRGGWPPECVKNIAGTHDYLDLLKVYSPYLLGLNMSSVKDSPTMFPRRVVEMIMANILVISDECEAVANLFPEIPRSGNASRTRDVIVHFRDQSQERLEIINAVKSRILSTHTYAAELSRIRTMISAL